MFVTLRRLMSAMSPFFRLIAGMVALYTAVAIEKEAQPGGEFFQDILVSVSKSGVKPPKLPFLDPAVYSEDRPVSRKGSGRAVQTEIPEAPLQRPPPRRPAVRPPAAQNSAPRSGAAERPAGKRTASEKFGGRSDFSVDREKGEIQVGNMRGRLPSRKEVKTATKDLLVERLQKMKALNGVNIPDKQIERFASVLIDNMPDKEFDITEENVIVGRPDLQAQLTQGPLPPSGASQPETAGGSPPFFYSQNEEAERAPSLPPSVRGSSPQVPAVQDAPAGPLPVNNVPSASRPTENRTPERTASPAPSAPLRPPAGPLPVNNVPPASRPTENRTPERTASPALSASLPASGLESPRSARRSQQNPVMELNVLYGKLFYNHHSTIAELSGSNAVVGMARARRARIFFDLWLNPDGTVQKLFLEGGYPAFFVEVAYEYLPGTSLFNKTLKHELTHVALYRLTLEHHMKNLAAEIVARVRKMPPQSKLEYINALMPLINEYTRKMDADAERRNSLIDGDENYEYQSEQLYHSAQYAKNIGKRREPCSDGPEQCRLREQTRQRIRQNNLKRYEEYYEAYNKAWETLNERRDDEIAADLKKKYLEVEVLKKPDGRRIFISKGRREK